MTRQEASAHMIVYFDMDGVLADFDRGLRELCGITPIPVNDITDHAYEEDMWAAIRAVPHFYGRLMPMPGALDMVRQIRDMGLPCEILTGIPRPRRGIDSAAADKAAWVERYLSPAIKTNIVFRADKPRFCKGPECVLIDDTLSNIAAWNAAGGTGILHERPEETLRQVAEAVERLTNPPA